MKYQAVAFATSTLMGLASAGSNHQHHHGHVRRVEKREVPLEHSHELYLKITGEFLNKNNPKKIGDPVFGLLGDAAAIKGAGQVTNLACLHQETADQAFTNAKAAKDIRGMSGALVYAALERNTQGVGKTSDACTDKAVNPEIAAIKQHQDPASDNAAATNKAIALELAKQLASVGGDPLLALESGTFAPGDKKDTTFRGNACDTSTDPVGCIFTEKKLVLDATPDEIKAAVAGITPTVTGGTGELKANHIDFAGLPVAGQPAGATTGGGKAANTSDSTAGSGNGNKNNGNKNAGSSKAQSKTEKDASCNANSAKAVGDNANNKASNSTTGGGGGGGESNTGTGNAAAGTNVQTFTGDLGGLPPPVLQTDGKRPFSVNGDSFVGKGAALGRSCDVQKNKCATAVNAGQLQASVSQCDEQNAECHSQNKLRRRRRRQDGSWIRTRQAANDFGKCTDPTIVFSKSLPDRKEPGFIPSNTKDFNHGSAQRIGIIAGFICDRLNDNCKAAKTTVANCKSAQQAAAAATQDQAAADAFNKVITGGAAGGGGNATAQATCA
ncbi:hypothetical protein Cob_v006314 [Colletotrichum orbiculare MAFF 240422]|uniref:Ribosomal protein s17 n=1 Tax=Colletotrichum orbiculare (strain 104-T / ATCC 96160 / CBS 514.97 / LARS 414 / MAFF 240422) TaxID=1213857 RepID=N4VKG1_COLOR|nr:hypothetical protein Cob_v006314 [Colletotrichum orbiculare MAFF 240422]